MPLSRSSPCRALRTSTMTATLATEMRSDGAVTIDDLLFFLAAFEAGDIAVDLDDGSGTGTPDEAVTVDDLLYFLVRFEGGC